MRQLTSKIAILTFVLGLLIGGVTAGVAVAAQQVHMNNALGYLNEARNELEAATHDKGGHRAQAVNLVDQAMHQVRLGIQYGDY